jgi:predicted DNA-binding transcriptional regulator AlpA
MRVFALLGAWFHRMQGFGRWAMTEGKVLSVASTKPMDPRAAAEFLGLDVKTITRWARQGYVPAHPLGEGKRKFWRFFESELIEWLAAKTNRSAVL